MMRKIIFCKPLHQNVGHLGIHERHPKKRWEAINLVVLY